MYTLQLPDAVQPWSHIILKLTAVFELEGLEATKNCSEQKLTVKCEPKPQKGSGKAGKVCGCRQEGEQSSSLATNY